MKQKTFEFIGSLGINLLVIVGVILVLPRLQEPVLQSAVSASVIVFFLLRFYYDNLKKLYKALVGCAFSKCDSRTASRLYDKLRSLDFLRLYHRRLFYVQCHLVMDLGEEADGAEFLRQWQGTSMLKKPGAFLSYKMAQFVYLFYLRRDADALHRAYRELYDYEQLHVAVKLSEESRNMAVAYDSLCQENRGKALSFLKRIDEKKLNNHDKAYFNCLYALTEDPNGVEIKKRRERAESFGSGIPLIANALRNGTHWSE